MVTLNKLRLYTTVMLSCQCYTCMCATHVFLVYHTFNAKIADRMFGGY